MITSEHLDQMRHAVGYYSANPGYRNAFCADVDNEVWTYLVDIDMADGKKILGAYGFWLTEKGKQLIGLEEQIDFVQSLNIRHNVAIKTLIEDHDIQVD